MKQRLAIFLGVLLVVSGIFLSLKSSEKDQLQTTVLAEAQHTTAQNYQKYCAGCHGDNLEKFQAKPGWMKKEMRRW